MNSVKIDRRLCDEIFRVFRYRSGTESGGLLCVRDGIVTDWFLDSTGSTGTVSYRPDAAAIVGKMREWELCGARGCFLHSHPAGRGISRQDVAFAEAFLRLNRLEPPLLFFILIGQRLTCYAIAPGSVTNIPLCIT